MEERAPSRPERDGAGDAGTANGKPGLGPPRPGRQELLFRWLPTAALSLLILAFGPAGSIVARWSREVPVRVVAGFGAVFLLAAIALLAWAVRRLRGDLARRLPWVLAALGLFVAQQLLSDRGSAVEQAVERMHFLLFGALAVTAFSAARRAFGRGDDRPRGGLLAATCSLLVVAWVAVVDEILQDALMARAGEFFDVGLNLFSGMIGVIASVGLFPVRWRGAGSGAGRRVLAAAAALPLVFTLLLDLAHLGTRVEVEGLGAFRSFYSEPALARANRDRAQRWVRRLPLQPPFEWWQLQDDFLVEGGWHVQARNLALEAGDLETVWIENTILERFYSSLLETGFAEELHPYRLKPWDLERLREAGAGSTPPETNEDGLVSDADRGRIWISPTRLQAWTVAGLISLALAVAARWRRARES